LRFLCGGVLFVLCFRGLWWEGVGCFVGCLCVFAEVFWSLVWCGGF